MKTNPPLAAERFIRVGPADVERLMSRLMLTEGDERSRKMSAFWVLIVLATVIATTGVMADSTATVIGAMIVAPLMTPILGTALSVVLADRRLIVKNLAMVAGGALSVVAIAYLLGMTAHAHAVAETNSQIAARVSPQLIDLVAALATGAVGAFAMVRSDVSDTLPGVAIAISLVPPLAVVGLTLEAGAPSEAWGALLLFATNVTAIIATGIVVFLAARVRRAATAHGVRVGRLTPRALVTVAAAALLITVPLAVGSAMVVLQELVLSKATPAANTWAASQGWVVSDISYRQGSLQIIAIGPPPVIEDAGLRRQLDAAGLESVDVRITLVLGGSRDLPGRR